MKYQSFAFHLLLAFVHDVIGVLAVWQPNKPKTKYQFRRMTSSDIKITNCRLAEIESEWHRATHPSKLFQEANNNEQGASSCWTEGRAAAKSSPEVAHGGKLDGRSVVLSLVSFIAGTAGLARVVADWYHRPHQ